jgi:hypothetical protein
MTRIFIGGLVEGVNFTYTKDENKPFFIDTDKCNDMIVVDRKYFLENLGLICAWASSVEKEQPKVIKSII